MKKLDDGRERREMSLGVIYTNTYRQPIEVCVPEGYALQINHSGWMTAGTYNVPEGALFTASCCVHPWPTPVPFFTFAPDMVDGPLPLLSKPYSFAEDQAQLARAKEILSKLDLTRLLNLSAPRAAEPYPHGSPLNEAVFFALDSYGVGDTFEDGVRALIAERLAYKKKADLMDKLLGYMGSNVKEGWDEVCRVGAVACYLSYPDALDYLDGLPVCNAGLSQRVEN
jgi:hypothetical protein